MNPWLLILGRTNIHFRPLLLTIYNCLFYKCFSFYTYSCFNRLRASKANNVALVRCNLQDVISFWAVELSYSTIYQSVKLVIWVRQRHWKLQLQSDLLDVDQCILLLMTTQKSVQSHERNTKEHLAHFSLQSIFKRSTYDFCYAIFWMFYIFFLFGISV